MKNIEYQNMLNSKLNPEVGLQISESVKHTSQPNQSSQENLQNLKNPQDEKQQSELSKNALNLMENIAGFFI